MPLNAVFSRPSIRFRDSFLEAAREFKSDGSTLQDMIGLDLEVVERDFERYLETRRGYENPALLKPGYVPQSEFWLVEDAVFMGRSKLRHTLNDALRKFGGHIGYEVFQIGFASANIYFPRQLHVHPGWGGNEK